MSAHTSVMRGKRVRVTLHNGIVIRARFIERTGQFIIIEGFRLRGRDVRAMVIDKESK